MRNHSNSYGGTGWTGTESLSFDGSTQYGEVTVLPEISGATNFSVSFWAYPTVSTDQYIFTHVNNGGNQFVVSLVGAYVRVRMYTAGVGARYEGTFGDAPLNTWTHVVVTYDGAGATDADKLKVYTDATSRSLVLGAGSPLPTSLTTGSVTNNQIGASHVFGNKLNGQLDQLDIWDYTLSGTDVTTLYNSNSLIDPYTLSTKPVHSYRFETGAGDDATTVQDFGTGTIRNITLTGTVIGDYTTDIP